MSVPASRWSKGKGAPRAPRQTSVLTPSESHLQASICAALRAIGCRVHENVVTKSGGGLGPGSPDLLVSIVGARPKHAEFVFMELKKPKEGRVSEIQKQWHEAAGRAQERVFTIRSVEEAVAVVVAIRSGKA